MKSEGTVSAGYVVGQFARALASAEQHPDADVRERAAEKVRKWQQVFAGMLEGSLAVGSRTPVAGAPAWATLEVAHGGVATGRLLAGGPLEPHETELAARLGGEVRAPEGRAALNLHYLTDAGRAELGAALRSGCYRVNVPEEGALLSVAWLLENGAAAEAEQIVEAIGPFFDRLRFFPVPDERPLVGSTTVRLQPLGKTIEGLRGVKPQRRVPVMNESLAVWAPLYDRAVALFLETVDGGWPCRTYPPGWAVRAKALLDDYATARAAHGLSRKPERKKENFARLRGYLERAVADPSSLHGRDVGMIRKVLASFVTRRGVPGSEELTRLRARQQEIAARPTHDRLRAVVLDRLAAFPAEGGLLSVDAVDAVAAPVAQGESARLGIPAFAPMPESVLRKLRRSLEAPVEELVEQGVIPSSEVLGLVLPQMTSQIRAAAIADPDLRRLYAAVYAAFRRRRSLLLLNLEHQVKLEELPWVAAMNRVRRADPSVQSAARESLRQVSLLALRSFPETIVPNKLLAELVALAKSAGLELPLVEELAADIFMGSFSEKFLRAAQDAARRLEGTLYERYYGAPFGEVLAIDDAQKTKHGAPSSKAFAALCSRLAGAGAPARSAVAQNGTVIEQGQILTTHNLASLVAGLGLETTLRTERADLARRCFAWVCREQQRKRDGWKHQLRTVKNAAYAWRQMLFFLSVDETSVAPFLAWAEHHFTKQTAAFRERFVPAVRGLRFVARGGRFDASGMAPDGGRRFLGWTTERHWVFGR